MFKTGIRINTLSQLEEKYIDFKNKVLNLEGSIMKNHQQIKLPFDDFLKKLLEVLIKLNTLIRKGYARITACCLLLSMVMLSQILQRIITFRSG